MNVVIYVINLILRPPIIIKIMIIYIFISQKLIMFVVLPVVLKRFVVFRDDLDLTAHMLKEHGGITGK